MGANNLIDSKMVYLITPFGVFIFLSKIHPDFVKSTHYIITLISFSFYNRRNTSLWLIILIWRFVTSYSG